MILRINCSSSATSEIVISTRIPHFNQGTTSRFKITVDVTAMSFGVKRNRTTIKQAQSGASPSGIGAKRRVCEGSGHRQRRTTRHGKLLGAGQIHCHGRGSTFRNGKVTGSAIEF